jgi:hypothetical protein
MRGKENRLDFGRSPAIPFVPLRECFSIAGFARVFVSLSKICGVDNAILVFMNDSFVRCRGTPRQ